MVGPLEEGACGCWWIVGFSLWLERTGISLCGWEPLQRFCAVFCFPAISTLCLHILTTIAWNGNTYIFFSLIFLRKSWCKNRGKRWSVQLWNTKIIIYAYMWPGPGHTLGQGVTYYTEEVCMSPLPHIRACCVLMMTLAHLPLSSLHSDILHSILLPWPHRASFMLASQHSV